MAGCPIRVAENLVGAQKLKNPWIRVTAVSRTIFTPLDKGENQVDPSSPAVSPQKPGRCPGDFHFSHPESDGKSADIGVLRRGSAMVFTVKKGSEKGSQKKF